jgi:phosphate transport system substrate-binding protein
MYTVGAVCYNIGKTGRMPRLFRSSILALFLSLSPAGPLPSQPAPAVIRLHGATTTIDRLIRPHRKAVETSTGLLLEVVGNATGPGLVDLVGGACDLALTSEPLDIALQAAKQAGQELDADEFEMVTVMHDEIVFIVHPSNPVSALTRAQIKDIHTGRLTNWSQLGGPSRPIIVFTDQISGGTRAMIRKEILNGEEYGAACRSVDTVRHVNRQVADLKGGFGGLGKGFVDPRRVKVIQTEPLVRPLGFIVRKGAVPPPVRRVIDAFLAEADKHERS